jgi:hypothetical protein
VNEETIDRSFLGTNDLIDGWSDKTVVTSTNDIPQQVSDLLNTDDLMTTGGGWEGQILNTFNTTKDGVSVDVWGHNSSDDFPHLVKGKGPEDGVQFISDSLGDQKSLEKSFLHNNVLFNISGDWGLDLGSGHDFLVNLNIYDLGWFIDNFGLSRDGLNNDLSVGWDDFDISSDLGDLTNSWLVDKEVSVDPVQKEFVGLDVLGSSSTKERCGVSVFTVDGWVDAGSLRNSTTTDDPVQVLFDGGNFVFSWVESGGSGVVDVTALNGGVSVVVDSLLSVWHGLGNDLQLRNNVLVEEDGVPEVGLELGNSPELLEEWGLNISSEDGWVLFIKLTEERDLEVLSEEWVGDNFLKGEDLHPTLSVGFKIFIPIGVVRGWIVVGGWIVKDGGPKKTILVPLVVEWGVEQFLAQKSITLSGQKRFLLGEKTKSVHVKAASSGDGHQSQHDESLHCRLRKEEMRPKRIVRIARCLCSSRQLSLIR